MGPGRQTGSEAGVGAEEAFEGLEDGFAGFDQFGVFGERHGGGWVFGDKKGEAVIFV